MITVTSGIAVISLICSLLVALTILFGNNMKSHPNKLIAYLSIANVGVTYTIFLWTVGTEDYVCYFGLS